MQNSIAHPLRFESANLNHYTRVDNEASLVVRLQRKDLYVCYFVQVPRQMLHAGKRLPLM